jgi:hypothetical protein
MLAWGSIQESQKSFFFFFFLTILGIELRTSGTLGKCSTTVLLSTAPETFLGNASQGQP